MTDAPVHQWERLHPASIAMHTLQNAPRTLIGLAGAAVALRDWAAAIVTVVAVLTLAASFVRWTRFRYMVDDEALRIESGLISLSRRVIPLARVQDVDIERGPLHRLFGLARVRAETGGADKDEGTLDGVAIGGAERLLDALRGRGAEVRDVAAPLAAETPVYRLTLPRLLLAGLFNFSLVWIALLASVAETVGRAVGVSIRDLERWVDRWTEREDVRAQLHDLTAGSYGGPDAGSALVVLAGIVAVLLLGIATGVVRTTLAHWRFTVHRRGRSLVVRRGLITVREVAVAVRRIQAARLSAGPLMRALGLVRVEVQTLGGAGGGSQGAGGGMGQGGRETIAPLADADEVAAVLEHALPVDLPASASYRGGSIRAWIADAAVVIAGAAIVAFGLAVGGLGAWSALPIALAVLGVLLARGRWHAHRWHLAERSEDALGQAAHLFVRRGWWRRRIDMLPLAKVQAVIVRQGPLARRLGLATVSVDSAGAGRALATPSLLLADARALALELVAVRARPRQIDPTSSG